MTRRISETDLNILAQRFYETKGPQVVLQSMTAKEDIVSGLRGVFETLGYEVVDGDRILLDILIPDMRIVPKITDDLADASFDVEDYRADLERRIKELLDLEEIALSQMRLADETSNLRAMCVIDVHRYRNKVAGLRIALSLLPRKS